MPPPNTNIEVLPSAARIATLNSADLDCQGRGVHVIIDVTVDPALASVVPKIQGFDPLSGTWYDLLVGVAITAVGTTVLKVYPGIAVAANVAASDVVPPVWRVRMEHADADSITYSVGAALVA
ncbi:hypothetical protein LCGC14_1295670 [marine sediment metagenome]|uniref:Uncharacterized protein n=1 Tax=marine sediment metagenome TaxID=412755 RepID=A0A0F9N7N7_9ZZZZ